jgi:hypothetical protein
LIVHLADTGHRQGGPFRDLTLTPEMHPAFEFYHPVFDLDAYRLGVDFGIAFEGFFEAVLDIDDIHPRPKGEAVAHANLEPGLFFLRLIDNKTLS